MMLGSAARLLHRSAMRTKAVSLLQELTEAHSVSGHEDEVRAIFVNELEECGELSADRNGSVFCAFSDTQCAASHDGVTWVTHVLPAAPYAVAAAIRFAEATEIVEEFDLAVVERVLKTLEARKAGAPPVLVAVIAFGMNFAAYVSEMFRTGIEGVDRGQSEAGIAMGFTPTSTFLHIVMPQALLRILPVYKGEFISLVKMTSIVGYIAVEDLTKASDLIRSRTFDAFFPLVLARRARASGSRPAGSTMKPFSSKNLRTSMATL